MQKGLAAPTIEQDWQAWIIAWSKDQTADYFGAL